MKSNRAWARALVSVAAGPQPYHFREQCLVFRIHQQHGYAQLLQRLGGAAQLQGQNDQIRLQGGAALQIELLGGTHAGQFGELRSAEPVDGAFVSFGFDAHHFFIQLQGNQKAGGDIIAADQLLGLRFDGHLAPRLIGEGDGIVAGVLGSGIFGGDIVPVSVLRGGFRGAAQLGFLVSVLRGGFRGAVRLGFPVSVLRGGFHGALRLGFLVGVLGGAFGSAGEEGIGNGGIRSPLGVFGFAAGRHRQRHGQGQQQRK